jgi:hypothetical protein
VHGSYEGFFQYLPVLRKAAVDTLNGKMHAPKVIDDITTNVQQEFVRLNELRDEDDQLPTDRLAIKRAIVRVFGHYPDPRFVLLIMFGSFATYHGTKQPGDSISAVDDDNRIECGCIRLILAALGPFGK